MKRATLRTAHGVVMAAGAPLGWLLVRRLQGIAPAADIAGNPDLYLYMLLATVLTFGVFGHVLGDREDRLLRANRELEELAVSDPLTGLRNARYFHARFAEEQAERIRTGEPLALVIIDLDHFKLINDRYGHLIGDDVLADAARAMASVTRQGETAARIGGEEFALLLPGSTGEAAREAADRALQAIAATGTRLPGEPWGAVRITASAGVASTAELPSADPRELYRAADEALYRAKSEGRNRSAVARAAT
jgi:diguanylate cyclase (GGDEF)-like protein